MKRIIGYTLIILQLIFIAIVVYQLEIIEKHSKEITLLTNNNDYFYDDDLVLMKDMYIEYEINKVQSSAWKIEEELKSNYPIYVTLVKNEEGMHEVKAVTKKRPQQGDPEDVLVKAKYSYEDDESGYYYVRYGFEALQDVEQFGTFKANDQLRITFLIGKWNQYELISIEAE